MVQDGDEVSTPSDVSSLSDLLSNGFTDTYVVSTRAALGLTGRFVMALPSAMLASSRPKGPPSRQARPAPAK
jgi:zona occludens toxin (predicted ATPase)